ncbi:uncharacterized protein KGF55_004091 [Candida pseudojiufengensis]|uniref:uncharacterized protein n=1 Tax=Candida pseudojiufengensis TaxID=497109 RepID=UPI00222513AA|nr:uncharacterized protein KGF55_004091 [Candida pseudojiufengensis]KAI5961166.1 hypothetical protein KGF55_004091 [Candida pseudojiufengensis]
MSSIYEESTSTILSPCESCITLQSYKPQQQFNEPFVNNYILARTNSDLSIRQSNKEGIKNEDYEIIIVYNHHDINIKLSSILSLINTHLTTTAQTNNKLTYEDLNINHLFLYLFYNQKIIFNSLSILINQFNLIHLGKSFEFKFNNSSTQKNSNSNTTKDKLMSNLNIKTFPKFLLNIKGTNYQTLENNNCFHFKTKLGNSINYELNEEEILNFLKRSINFKDKSNGSITYIDSLRTRIKRSSTLNSIKSIKSNKSSNSTNSTNLNTSTNSNNSNNSNNSTNSTNSNNSQFSNLITTNSNNSNITIENLNCNMNDKFIKRKKIKNKILKCFKILIRIN